MTEIILDLKRMPQNCSKILKKYFLVTDKINSVSKDFQLKRSKYDKACSTLPLGTSLSIELM